MDSFQKQTFTRRITESNRSELIVVLYDIFFASIQEARKGFTEGRKGFSDDAESELNRAEQVLDHLRNDLSYTRQTRDLSLHLRALYDYCLKQLARSSYTGTLDGINESERIMKELYPAFVEVARQDSSRPLMQNTEKIVAGVTYGKNNLTEMTESYDPSRGYCV